MPNSNFSDLNSKIIDQIPFFNDLMNLSATLNAKTYIVGGTVRDILLNTQSIDIDIVVFNYDYEQFAIKLSKLLKTHHIPFKDNISLMDKSGRHIADISKPRADNIITDLALRDFTINNLAIDHNYQVIGDKNDLRNKIIRATNDKTFIHDPLRIIRAFRFLSTLNFEIDFDTLILIKRDLELLPSVAYERVSHELEILISGDNYITALKLMYDNNILQTIFDHIDYDIDCLLRIDDIKTDLKELLYPFILSSIIINESTVKILKKLKLSNANLKFISLLNNATNDLLNIFDDDKKIKTFCYRYYDRFKIILDYCYIKNILSTANISILKAYYDKINIANAKYIDGDILQSFGIKPSPIFKNILDQIKVMLVFDDIKQCDIEKYIKEIFL